EASAPPAFPPADDGNKGEKVNFTFWLSPGHVCEPGVWYAGSSPPALFRSEDCGDTWQGVEGFNTNPMRRTWIGDDDEGPPGGATLHSFQIDPRDANHLYIGCSIGGVFDSIDHGASWQPLNKGIHSYFLPEPEAEFGHDPHALRIHPQT